MPLPRAVKPLRMTGLQRAAVLLDSDFSLILPVGHRKPQQGKGLAEMSQLVRGRARTHFCLLSLETVNILLRNRTYPKEPQ